MIQWFINQVLLRHFRAQRSAKQFLACLESEVTEEFLELLLKTMRLFLLCNKKYRKNITGFSGRYLFRSSDNKITIAAEFRQGKIKVYEGVPDMADIIVIFKNAAALRNFLLSPKPDILNSVLNQDIILDGNFNYLYKFAYMAKHLPLVLTGRA